MIKKDDKIASIVEKYPQTADILFSFGMGCVGCPSAANETLEQGALKHGLSEEDIQELLDEINDCLDD